MRACIVERTTSYTRTDKICYIRMYWDSEEGTEIELCVVKYRETSILYAARLE